MAYEIGGAGGAIGGDHGATAVAAMQNILNAVQTPGLDPTKAINDAAARYGGLDKLGAHVDSYLGQDPGSSMAQLSAAMQAVASQPQAGSQAGQGAASATPSTGDPSTTPTPVTGNGLPAPQAQANIQAQQQAQAQGQGQTPTDPAAPAGQGGGGGQPQPAQNWGQTAAAGLQALGVQNSGAIGSAVGAIGTGPGGSTDWSRVASGGLQALASNANQAATANTRSAAMAAPQSRGQGPQFRRPGDNLATPDALVGQGYANGGLVGLRAHYDEGGLVAVDDAPLPPRPDPYMPLREREALRQRAASDAAMRDAWSQSDSADTADGQPVDDRYPAVAHPAAGRYEASIAPDPNEAPYSDFGPNHRPVATAGRYEASIAPDPNEAPYTDFGPNHGGAGSDAATAAAYSAALPPPPEQAPYTDFGPNQGGGLAALQPNPAAAARSAPVAVTPGTPAQGAAAGTSPPAATQGGVPSAGAAGGALTTAPPGSGGIVPPQAGAAPPQQQQQQQQPGTATGANVVPKPDGNGVQSVHAATGTAPTADVQAAAANAPPAAKAAAVQASGGTPTSQLIRTDPWLILFQMGAGMMASNRHDLLGVIGQGMLAGTSFAQKEAELGVKAPLYAAQANDLNSQAVLRNQQARRAEIGLRIMEQDFPGLTGKNPQTAASVATPLGAAFGDAKTVQAAIANPQGYDWGFQNGKIMKGGQVVFDANALQSAISRGMLSGDPGYQKWAEFQKDRYDKAVTNGYIDTPYGTVSLPDVMAAKVQKFWAEKGLNTRYGASNEEVTRADAARQGAVKGAEARAQQAAIQARELAVQHDKERTETVTLDRDNGDGTFSPQTVTKAQIRGGAGGPGTAAPVPSGGVGGVAGGGAGPMRTNAPPVSAAPATGATGAPTAAAAAAAAAMTPLGQGAAKYRSPDDQAGFEHWFGKGDKGGTLTQLADKADAAQNDMKLYTILEDALGKSASGPLQERATAWKSAFIQIARATGQNVPESLQQEVTAAATAGKLSNTLVTQLVRSLGSSRATNLDLMTEQKSVPNPELDKMTALQLVRLYRTEAQRDIDMGGAAADYTAAHRSDPRAFFNFKREFNASHAPEQYVGQAIGMQSGDIEKGVAAGTLREGDHIFLPDGRAKVITRDTVNAIRGAAPAQQTTPGPQPAFMSP